MSSPKLMLGDGSIEGLSCYSGGIDLKKARQIAPLNEAGKIG